MPLQKTVVITIALGVFFNASPYRAVGQDILEQTEVIGSAELPTIEGGIIHAAPCLPLYAGHLVSKVLPYNPIMRSSSYFNDDWATAKQVKTFLKESIKQGKLAYVLKKSEDMDLPASVAVLPMIESGYQVDAVSPRGAAGAWQLMPAVAKDYGLNNQERFQFMPATDTALQLLKDLHERFGNWTLAFAAYHAGSARLAQSLRKNPTAYAVNALDLPLETKQYIHKLSMLNQTFIRLAHDSP